MNAGIGANNLRVVLDQVVRIHAQARADRAEGIAQESPVNFLALSGLDRGQGEGRTLGKHDRIGVSVGWIDNPCEGIVFRDLRRVWIRFTTADLHSVRFGLGTFLDIGTAAATRDTKKRGQ